MWMYVSWGIAAHNANYCTVTVPVVEAVCNTYVECIVYCFIVSHSMSDIFTIKTLVPLLLQKSTIWEVKTNKFFTITMLLELLHEKSLIWESQPRLEKLLQILKKCTKNHQSE